jgi:hypothetical protein
MSVIFSPPLNIQQIRDMSASMTAECHYSRSTYLSILATLETEDAEVDRHNEFIYDFVSKLHHSHLYHYQIYTTAAITDAIALTHFLQTRVANGERWKVIYFSPLSQTQISQQCQNSSSISTIASSMRTIGTSITGPRKNLPLRQWNTQKVLALT